MKNMAHGEQYNMSDARCCGTGNCVINDAGEYGQYLDHAPIDERI